MAIRSMRAAIIFLSRIPAGGFPFTEEEFKAAPGHFPFVGLLVGLTGAPFLLLTEWLGPWLAATLAVGATIWTTGAFHEDGLADTADALGGAHSRKKIHDILKDSRIGTYGACALVLSLLIRVLGFGQMSVTPGLNPVSDGAWTEPLLFVLVHVLARVGPVSLMAALPYVAGEGAKGSSVARGGDAVRVSVAMSWGAVILGACVGLGLSPVVAGLLVLVGALTTTALGHWFHRRAGGFTGDFLGATEQALEMVLLLTLLLSASFWKAP